MPYSNLIKIIRVEFSIDFPKLSLAIAIDLVRTIMSWTVHKATSA